MASGARFKIGSSISADRGYDAAPGATLALQLEANPALDVDLCVYSCPIYTLGATAPSFASGGVATPPTAPVNVTLGLGAHAYLIKGQTNNGVAVPGPDGKPDFSVNTFYRVIAVRTTAAGARKMIVGETLEYHPTQGWIEAFNALVDILESITAGGLAVSSGLHFPANGTFIVDQLPAIAAQVPGAALIAAQDAHTGDAIDGAKLTIRDGRPGDNEHHGGDVEIDLGPLDVNDTQSAVLKVLADSTVRLSVFVEAPTLIVATPDSLAISASNQATFSVISGSDVAYFTIDPGSAYDIFFTGKRLSWSGQIFQFKAVITANGNVSMDFDSRGNQIDISLSGNSTILAPSNVQRGATYTFQIAQGGGGPYTLTWNAAFKFGATSSAVTAVAGAIDIFTFRGDTSNVLRLVSVSKGVQA